MPSYLTPGVYVEEVQSGARPIEGVGTAVAALVGFAETGPFHEPTLVTSWDQYVQTFGGFTEGTYLPHAVYGFFANGGGSAYVVRVGGAAVGGGPAPVGRAPEPTAVAGFLFSALPGAGGDVSVEIADAEGENVPEDRFRLLVRKGTEVAETYDVSTRRNNKGYLVTQLRESKLVAVTEQPGTAPSRPERQTVALAETPAAAPAPVPPAPGSTRPSTWAMPRPAPDSRGWRRSTRSPWSRCPT